MITEEKYQFIKTYARQRPPTKDEIELKRIGVRTVSDKEVVIKTASGERKFYLDKIFGADASQLEVYSTVVSPLLQSVVQGYNCTILGYGQIGTGKSYTMIGGNIGPSVNFDEDPTAGIIPRAASQLFMELEKLEADIKYTVTLSLVEIHNEELHDVLDSERCLLKMYEDPDNKGSVLIKNLTEITVYNAADVHQWLKLAVRQLHASSTGQTQRSHVICTFMVHTWMVTGPREETRKTGKLHLVDLAGNDNVGRSGLIEAKAREAGTINKSLFTLNKVIKALAQKAQHVPYRDSKLTRILRDSLGGNTKTCLIATFSSGFDAWDDTVITLEHAQMACKVANMPIVNVNKKQALLMQDHKDEIGRLRRNLEAARNLEGVFVHQNAYEKMKEDIKKQDQTEMEIIDEIYNVEKGMEERQMGFVELEASFRATEAYLAKKKQELKQSKKKNRQNQYVMKYLKRRGKHLGENSANLLDACESTTTCEDIYCRKHQNQCKTSDSNATISKALISGTITSLNSLEMISKKILRHQEGCLQDTKYRARLMTKNQSQIEGELALVRTELKKKVNEDSLDVMLDSQQEYTEDNVKKFMGGIFSKVIDVYGQEQDGQITKIYNSRDRMVKDDQELQARTGRIFAAVSEEWEQRRAYHDSLTSLAVNIYGGMNDQLTEMEKQRANSEDFSMELRNFEESMRRFEAELKEEDEVIGNKFEKMLSCIERFETSETAEKLMDKLVDFEDQESEITTSTLREIYHLTNTVQSFQVAAEDELSFQKQETSKYISDMYDAFNAGAERHNEELGGFFRDASGKLDGIRRDLESGLECSDKIKQSVEHVAHANSEFRTNTNDFIRKAREENSRFDEIAKVPPRAGDTPAKQTYDYPKVIKAKISDQDLMNQLDISY